MDIEISASEALSLGFWIGSLRPELGTSVSTNVPSEGRILFPTVADGTANPAIDLPAPLAAAFETSAFKLLRSQFASIVPNFRYLESEWCSHDAISEGLIRVDVDPELALAVHPSVPNTVYELYTWKPVRKLPIFIGATTWRRGSGRKSLVDLVFLELGDYLRLSRAERLFLEIARSSGFEKRWPEVVRWFEAQNAEPFVRKITAPGHDRPEELDESIRTLVARKDWEEQYAIGKLFGQADRLLGALLLKLAGYDWQGLEAVMEGATIADEEHLKKQVFAECPVRRHAEELLEHGFVASSQYARGLLERVIHDIEDSVTYWDLWAAWNLISQDHSGAGFIQNPAAERAIGPFLNVQKLMWGAYGELLGILREQDLLFEQAQLEAVEPRAFREPITTPDKAAELLTRARKRFDDPNRTPEEIVRLLDVIIEGIVREVWTERTRLMELLHQKIKSRDQNEANLARIAIPLVVIYRNPASHDMDFACSFDEATYFFWGARAMVDLWRRIEESRHAGRSEEDHSK